MVLRSLLLLTALSGAATAGPIIDCQSPDADPIRLRLDADTFEGQSLSCIDAPFIADMTPCAPNGGWGLSAPTGTAALVGVVDRWQEYSDHLGGVIGFWATDTRIHFSGGFNSPGQAMGDPWDFDIDRITGGASLTLSDKAAVAYTCGKVEPLF